jgi:outer membrane receptor protein involved in Fe transport
VVGSPMSIYSQLATLGPYINLDPSPQDIDAVYGHYTVDDPHHIGQAGVQAIFDYRPQNIASTQAAGLELMLQTKVTTGAGDLTFRLGGQYLAKLDNRSTPTTPYVSDVNTAFNPPLFRIQGGPEWSHKGWKASFDLGFTDSYKDPLVANAPDVASWLTLNTRAAYTTGSGSGALHNITVALNIINLGNRLPPYLEGLPERTTNYDPTNSSAAGRNIVVEIKKHW